jgi:hypothetical protein
LVEGAPAAASSSASSSGKSSGASFSGATPGALSPRQRRIEDPWVITLQIEAAPGVLARQVGSGFLLLTPDGAVTVLGAEAALLWDLLSTASRTYAELLDAVCERCGGSYADVEQVVLPLLGSWTLSGAVRGLERVDAVRSAAPPSAAPAGSRERTIGGARCLGRLDLMRLAASPSTPPSLGGSPTLHDVTPRVEHVAIVCQYGIQGLAPGVELYTRRCIARLRRLRPDLVILAGGGRHGGSELREAESVIDRYRALYPGRSLWLEKHSETTWENLQHSLELLLARRIVPRRVTLLGDRSRVEKLRLACWLARRRFAPFRGASFRVVPVTRPRFTWRDSRPVQIVVGIAQVLRESRGTTLASAGDAAGTA